MREIKPAGGVPMAPRSENARSGPVKVTANGCHGR